jgi:hypothetical protein
LKFSTLNEIRDILPETKIPATTDILRIPKDDQFYRYRKYCNFSKRSIFADWLDKSIKSEGQRWLIFIAGITDFDNCFEGHSIRQHNHK